MGERRGGSGDQRGGGLARDKDPIGKGRKLGGSTPESKKAFFSENAGIEISKRVLGTWTPGGAEGRGSCVKGEGGRLREKSHPLFIIGKDDAIRSFVWTRGKRWGKEWKDDRKRGKATKGR